MVPIFVFILSTLVEQASPLYIQRPYPGIPGPFLRQKKNDQHLLIALSPNAIPLDKPYDFFFILTYNRASTCGIKSSSAGNQSTPYKVSFVSHADASCSFNTKSPDLISQIKQSIDK